MSLYSLGDVKKVIVSVDDYMFWEADDLYWNGETYWFDDSLDWVVYKSHEGTITFGGRWLVDRVKEVWSEWPDYAKWDTKN